MWWRVVVWFFFPFFVFPSVFLHLQLHFFVTVGFCFVVIYFFIKHLRSRTPTQHEQRLPAPTPGPQPGWGVRGPLGVFVAVFLVSGTGGQARGPGRGVCTAEGNRTRERLSRGPRRRTTLGKGPGTRRRRRAPGEGRGPASAAVTLCSRVAPPSPPPGPPGGGGLTTSPVR